MLTATPSDTGLNARVGPYVLDAVIGEGAHGKVYRAHHRDTPQTTVAVKVIPSRGNPDRLLVEPQILSKLRHPGIVGLLDYFIDSERLIVVLEFLDGGDLKTYMASHGLFSAAETRDFLRQMASALQHAHAAGILHRDIKPANILVVQTESGPRYVLTDFGISRVAEGLQLSRNTGGTYQYMAPEQLRGRPAAQSDLWALGVVAYELLTQTLPFVGDTIKQLAAEVLYKSPAPLLTLQKQAHDEGLANLIYGLVEKQLGSRTKTAAELLDQLGVTAVAGKKTQQDVPVHRLTIDAQAQRKIRWYSVGCVLSGLLWSGPLLIPPTLIVLLGIWCFYNGQRWIFASRLMKGSLLTLAALIVLIFGYMATQAFPAALVAGLKAWSVTRGAEIDTQFLSQILLGVQVSAVFFSLIFTPLTVYLFSKLRALQRQRGLRQAITENSGDACRQLEILKAMAQERTEDLEVRQKYAEALLAQGHLKEAIVEAKLMLHEDPYNMATGLLLAHSYFELGLFDLTISVCDSFLAVAGYCFEFRELRVQAVNLSGAIQ